MLKNSKREILAILSGLAVVMCGCAGQESAAVTRQNQIQQETKQMGAYVTIEEEEVPLAAVPHEWERNETNETVQEESESPMVETKETTEMQISEQEQQPTPTMEVEVSLQEEDAQMKVVVETTNSFDAAAFAAEVQQAVNETRASAGLPALSTTSELSAAAAQRASEIAGSFSHTRPDGTDYHTAVTQAGGGFGSIGENLFRGMDSLDAITGAWNSSQVHLDNILNSDFTHIGIGVAETPNGVYVVQIFTN